MTMMEVRMRSVGSWEMNAYVLVCPTSRASVLIDPGDEPEVLLQLLAGTQPVAILITHTHSDHIDALDVIRARLGLPVLASGGPYYDNFPLKADRILKDGDTIQVGHYTLRVYHTPGHCADTLSFSVVGTPTMIVGDTIFPGGPGDTANPEDFQVTLATLRDGVLSWPDDTICYPGHGQSFRLGDERRAIEAFIKRDHGRFFGDATWDM